MKPLDFIIEQKDISSLTFSHTTECYFRIEDVETILSRWHSQYHSLEHMAKNPPPNPSINFSIQVVTFHFKPKKNKPSYYATVWNSGIPFEEFVKNTIGRLKETRMWRKRTLVRIDYPIAGKIKDI